MGLSKRQRPRAPRVAPSRLAAPRIAPGAVRSTEEAAVHEGFHPGRDRSRAPEPAVDGALDRANPALACELAGTGIQRRVLAPQRGIVPAIAPAILRQLRRRGVPAILERHRVN